MCFSRRVCEKREEKRNSFFRESEKVLWGRERGKRRGIVPFSNYEFPIYSGISLVGREIPYLGPEQGESSDQAPSNPTDPDPAPLLLLLAFRSPLKRLGL